MQAESSWSFSEDDTLLGQIIRPLKRVGVYVPAGRPLIRRRFNECHPRPGCRSQEIAVCVPVPGGEINPYVMAAVRMLGVKEIYKIGGAQAVAAMAFGTKSIRKVDKIVGPGNIYVATAKKMVFGIVDIDMIAGPSEILIIADSSADAAFVAADMLSQAEHDELASAVLITDSRQLAEKVSHEIYTQLAGLKRHRIASASLEKFSAIVLTRNIPEAVRISNQIALSIWKS